MNDQDMFDFLKGLRITDTKETLTNKYVAGDITKDEYFRRMKKLQDKKRRKQ